MTFADVVHECLQNQELVRHFNRLSGASIGTGGIAGAVDEATGKRDADILAFIRFVDEYIWQRVAKRESPFRESDFPKIGLG